MLTEDKLSTHSSLEFFGRKNTKVIELKQLIEVGQSQSRLCIRKGPGDAKAWHKPLLELSLNVRR